MHESIQELMATIIVSHPNEESLVSGCCRAIASHLRDSGVIVEEIDLYRDGFDPVLSQEEVRRKTSFDERVLAYQQAVKRTNLLVVGHPDWWGGVPAILKGFVDRVFRPGVAFVYDGPEFGRRSLRPLLGGTKALIAATTDRPVPEGEDILSRFWQEGVFSYCGIDLVSVRVLYSTRDTRLRQRRAWIDATIDAAESLLNR